MGAKRGPLVKVRSRNSKGRARGYETYQLSIEEENVNPRTSHFLQTSSNGTRDAEPSSGAMRSSCSKMLTRSSSERSGGDVERSPSVSATARAPLIAQVFDQPAIGVR
jgi:hypothetical protein